MQHHDAWIKFVSYETSRLSNKLNLHLFYIISSQSSVSSNSVFLYNFLSVYFIFLYDVSGENEKTCVNVAELQVTY